MLQNLIIDMTFLYPNAMGRCSSLGLKCSDASLLFFSVYLSISLPPNLLKSPDRCEKRASGPYLKVQCNFPIARVKLFHERPMVSAGITHDINNDYFYHHCTD